MDMSLTKAQDKLGTIQTKLYGEYGADSKCTTTLIRDYDRKPIGQIVNVEWYPSAIKDYDVDYVDSLITELFKGINTEGLSMGGSDFTKTKLIDGKPTIVNEIRTRFVSVYVPFMEYN